MALEIERKFLVKGDFKKEAHKAYHIVQGYISPIPGKSVRVRIRDNEGFLTIKGKRSSSGLSRFEWEKPISLEEATELLNLCDSKVIDKTRHLVKAGDHTFEVDEFHGDNEGLVVAEVELGSEDEAFDRPDWLGEEVSADPRYRNSALISNPYKNWDKA
ncbi:MAG: CYTH domain-containing protein [Bacteroidales bacterium]|nr:CYTH domain-containing protein [Bacteroidales bacterium]